MALLESVHLVNMEAVLAGGEARDGACHLRGAAISVERNRPRHTGRACKDADSLGHRVRRGVGCVGAEVGGGVARAAGASVRIGVSGERRWLGLRTFATNLD